MKLAVGREEQAVKEVMPGRDILGQKISTAIMTHIEFYNNAVKREVKIVMPLHPALPDSCK